MTFIFNAGLQPWGNYRDMWIRWGDGSPADNRPPPHQLPAEQVQGIEKDAGPLFCPMLVGEGYGVRRAHGWLRVKKWQTD